MIMQSGNLIFGAALKHYEAEIARSKANLATIFENPRSVGSDVDIMTQVLQWTEKMAMAELCHQSLTASFEEEGEVYLEEDEDEDEDENTRL